ncbi:hypothetical protein M422DRAFT_777144 [Sphaerobolus stellatus SS14]|nr:hypothetical protein M422DRAFT_777144 [Sphaerobolus stellatus SS14]
MLIPSTQPPPPGHLGTHQRHLPPPPNQVLHAHQLRRKVLRQVQRRLFERVSVSLHGYGTQWLAGTRGCCLLLGNRGMEGKRRRWRWRISMKMTSRSICRRCSRSRMITSLDLLAPTTDLSKPVTQIYPQPPVASTSSAAAVRPPAAAPSRARTPEPIYPYPPTQSAAVANLDQPAQPPAPAVASVAQPAPQPAPAPQRTPSFHPAVTASTPAARKHLHLPLILPLLHRHPCPRPYLRPYPRLPLHPFENPLPRRLNARCWFRRPKGPRRRRVRRWGAIWLCLHRLDCKLHMRRRIRIGIRLRLQGLVIPPLPRRAICALRHRVVWGRVTTVGDVFREAIFGGEGGVDIVMDFWDPRSRRIIHNIEERPEMHHCIPTPTCAASHHSAIEFCYHEVR